jgi:polyphosphate kinase
MRYVLELSMGEGTEGWDLDGDGIWHRNVGTPGKPQLHLQEALLRRVIGKKS